MKYPEQPIDVNISLLVSGKVKVWETPFMTYVLQKIPSCMNAEIRAVVSFNMQT